MKASLQTMVFLIDTITIIGLMKIHTVLKKQNFKTFGELMYGVELLVVN